MPKINLSKEDTEYIRFLLDNIIQQHETSLDNMLVHVDNAHTEYFLASDALDADEAILRGYIKGLAFIEGVRNRLRLAVEASVTEDTL